MILTFRHSYSLAATLGYLGWKGTSLPPWSDNSFRRQLHTSWENSIIGPMNPLTHSQTHTAVEAPCTQWDAGQVSQHCKKTEHSGEAQMIWATDPDQFSACLHARIDQFNKYSPKYQVCFRADLGTAGKASDKGDVLNLCLNYHTFQWEDSK